MSRFKIGGRSSSTSTLIVGCGKEGTKWTRGLDINKKHQHASKGEKTIDIDADNKPDLVADFTQPLAGSAGFRAMGLFSKVKFEAVPGNVMFGSADTCATVAENIHTVSADRSKVTVRTGPNVNTGRYFTHFGAALEAKGYTIKKQDPDNGQLKAVRK